MAKGKILVGKTVEIVPWHKTFRDKEYILTGKLVKVKEVETSAYNPEKKKRVKLGKDTVFVVKPADSDRKEMLHSGLMKPRQRIVYRVASGHKIRRKM